MRTEESTGSSREGWDAAILDAVATAKKRASDVVGFEVVRLQGELSRGRIRTYRATVRVAYRERVVGP